MAPLWRYSRSHSPDEDCPSHLLVPRNSGYFAYTLAIMQAESQCVASSRSVQLRSVQIVRTTWNSPSWRWLPGRTMYLCCRIPDDASISCKRCPVTKKLCTVHCTTLPLTPPHGEHGTMHPVESKDPSPVHGGSTDSKPKPSTRRHEAISCPWRSSGYAWRKWFASLIPNGSTFEQGGGGCGNFAGTTDCSVIGVLVV